MKKIRQGLGIFIAAVLIFAFAGQAGAFCVHNKSDQKMYTKQTANQSFWKGFQATLEPGTDSCCNWANTDCNKSGGKTDLVSFRVQFNNDAGAIICRDMKIPACSDLDVIKDGSGNYICVAHGVETCN